MLLAGHRVGPYVVVSPLGSGGMGDVYLADDTRLKRRVALKVLSETADSGLQGRERLLREARAAARLDHVNICTIFDAGEADGVAYIAMQFIDGESLASRLNRRPMELRDALDVAAQTAHALAEAHRHGIVHRDVKPDNVMLTSGGLVKVLDFGIAWMTGPVAGSETTVERLTEAGAVAGTVRYMSPEQLRGEAVDERSDIFSLGTVVHEMLGRAHPFAEASGAETIAAILTREPPQLGDHIPADVRRIVSQCLEKDRTRRYQSARDLAINFETAARELAAPAGRTTASGVPAVRAAGRRWLWWAAALVILGIAASLILRGMLNRPAPVPSTAEYVPVTSFPDSATAPAISPDGTMVAFLRGGEQFLTRGQVWVKRLAGGDAKQLTNDSRQKYGVAFSPDGNRVAYTVVDRGDWSTWSVPVIGGEATQLLPNAAGLTWIDDRQLLFSEIRTGLHMGVVTATAAREGKRNIYFPAHERAMAHYSAISPDRRWILITEMTKTGGWDRCRVVPFEGAESVREVGPPGSCLAAGWSPDGRWMYFAVNDGMNSHLWRQRFPSGAPEPLTSGPATDEQGLAVAPDGQSLITSIGQRSSSVWLHAAGTREPRLLSGEGFAIQPMLSRDGRKVFCLLRGVGVSALQLTAIDLASGRIDALVPGTAMIQFDLSPDESSVAYVARSASGESQVWIASLDRAAPPRKLVDNADSVWFLGPDDLIYRAVEGHANFLERIKRDGSGKSRLVDHAVLTVLAASPDGRWAVTQLPGSSSTNPVDVMAIPIQGGERKLICGGFCGPAWSADGRYFYVSDHSLSRTLVIPVRPGEAFPEFPADGSSGADVWASRSSTRFIEEMSVAEGSAPERYVSVRVDQVRNLFRIPIR